MLEFLREFAAMELPRQFTDAGDIDHLRVLQATQLVDADMPIPNGSAVATLTGITAKGWAVLQRHLEDPTLDTDTLLGAPPMVFPEHGHQSAHDGDGVSRPQRVALFQPRAGAAAAPRSQVRDPDPVGGDRS